MYPINALTIFNEFSASGTSEILPTADRTLLSYSVSNGTNNNEVSLKCGSTIVSESYSIDSFYSPILYHCNNTVSITRSGGGHVAINMTYVPYDLSTTTPPSSAQIDPAFATALGDVARVSFIFQILTLLILAFFVGQWIFKK